MVDFLMTSPDPRSSSTPPSVPNANFLLEANEAMRREMMPSPLEELAHIPLVTSFESLVERFASGEHEVYEQVRLTRREIVKRLQAASPLPSEPPPKTVTISGVTITATCGKCHTVLRPEEVATHACPGRLRAAPEEPPRPCRHCDQSEAEHLKFGWCDIPNLVAAPTQYEPKAAPGEPPEIKEALNEFERRVEIFVEGPDCDTDQGAVEYRHNERDLDVARAALISLYNRQREETSVTADEALVCWRALNRVPEVGLVEHHPAYLSAHRKMQDWARPAIGHRGTFHCPKCGNPTPHRHDEAEQLTAEEARQILSFLHPFPKDHPAFLDEHAPEIAAKLRRLSQSDTGGTNG